MHNYLVFDLETDGLLDELTKIHVICVRGKDYVESFSDFDDDLRPLSVGLDLLSDCGLAVGHNIIGYDIPAIRKLYPGWRAPRLFDTFVASQVIWSNMSEIDQDIVAQLEWDARKLKESLKEDATSEELARKLAEIKYRKRIIGSHSLEAHGFRFGLHKGNYADNNTWETYSQEMREYCQRDVDITYALYRTILKQKYSPECLAMEMHFADIIERQSRFGWRFDIEKAKDLNDRLASLIGPQANTLKTIFKPKIVKEVFVPRVNNKTRGYFKGVPFTKTYEVEFNPNSRPMIAERLIEERGWKPKEYTDSGKPKISEKIIEKLIEDNPEWPELQPLHDYLMLQKRISQLSDGSTSLINSAKDRGERGHRIHGRAFTNGAVTGRMRHYAPNVAQVPSSGKPYGYEFRELFTVDPGYTLLGVDASGLELRCLGHYMSKWDGGAYIDALLNGDIHWVNTLALGLVPEGTVRDKDNPDHENARRTAKTFIYAFLYGAGDKKMGSIIGGSAADGKRLKERFLATLPALESLLSWVDKLATTKKQLPGLDGRILHIRSPHAALNTLLQSAGALIIKRATCIIDDNLSERYIYGKDFAQVGHIHDEIQLQVRTELVRAVEPLLLESFLQAGKSFSFACPTDAEVKVGYNWAETH